MKAGLVRTSTNPPKQAVADEASPPKEGIIGEARLRLSKQERLRRSQEFQEVYARGRRLSAGGLTLFFKPNQLTISRLGLSVNKKGCKSSVRRHFILRRLREAYRLNKKRFLSGYDLVLVSRLSNNEAVRFSLLKEELLSLARKAGLLKEDQICSPR